MIGAIWFVAIGVIGAMAWGIIDARTFRRQSRRLAMRRENPSDVAFVEMLAGVADPEVAEWVWGELSPYWQPAATPHPDDDFLSDLPIDPEESGFWLCRFCGWQGIEPESFPSWPYGKETTVRNLAAWLSDGRKPASTSL